MFITKLAAPPDVPPRHGCHAGVAAARLDGAGVDRHGPVAASPSTGWGPSDVPHGVIMDQWMPADHSAPLRVHADPEAACRAKDRLLVVSNLARPETGPTRTTPARRRRGSPACAQADRRPRLPARRHGRPVIAGKIGQDTTFPSLEVATEDFTALLGSCAPGYSCAYANTLSWQSPTTPLPMEINPRVLFERMFGGGGTTEQRRARMQRGPQHSRFRRRGPGRAGAGIGARDRIRLDEYLDNVREVERRIQRAETAGAVARRGARRPGRHSGVVRGARRRCCSSCWRWPTRPTSPACSRS